MDQNRIDLGIRPRYRAPTKTVLDGLKMVQAGRTKNGKRKGGGLTVIANDRWCNSDHISIEEQLSSKDIELLSIIIRPYYLPWEFSHVIMIAIYISQPVMSVTQLQNMLQAQHPHSVLISGDFNHVSLSTFTQYITCYSRDNRIPPIRRSDHNLCTQLSIAH